MVLFPQRNKHLYEGCCELKDKCLELQQYKTALNYALAVGLIFLALVLATGYKLLNEHEETLLLHTKLEQRQDMLDAAKTSIAYWQRKYDAVSARKPLTAAQRKLIAKYDAAQVKK